MQAGSRRQKLRYPERHHDGRRGEDGHIIIHVYVYMCIYTINNVLTKGACPGYHVNILLYVTPEKAITCQFIVLIRETMSSPASPKMPTLLPPTPKMKSDDQTSPQARKNQPSSCSERHVSQCRCQPAPTQPIYSVQYRPGGRRGAG